MVNAQSLEIAVLPSLPHVAETDRHFDQMLEQPGGELGFQENMCLY